MIKESIVCDICGKQKGEVNHWWRMYADKTSAEIMPWCDDMETYWRDYCGQECLTKALSAWMQEVHAPQK